MRSAQQLGFIRVSERSTAELIETLAEDVDRCHAELVATIDGVKPEEDGSVHVEYEFHARQLIRAIFAYFEGVIFSVKVSSMTKCLDLGIKVTDHERYLAVEIDAGLNEKGEVEESPSRLRFASNMRFAFRLLDRANGGRLGFDPSASWWSDLKRTIRVRDRLMHPRMPGDLDISGDELVTALRAVLGFDELLMRDVPGVSPNRSLEQKSEE